MVRILRSYCFNMVSAYKPHISFFFKMYTVNFPKLIQNNGKLKLSSRFISDVTTRYLQFIVTSDVTTGYLQFIVTSDVTTRYLQFIVSSDVTTRYLQFIVTSFVTTQYLQFIVTSNVTTQYLQFIVFLMLLHSTYNSSLLFNLG